MTHFEQAAEQAYQTLLAFETGTDDSDKRFYAGYLLGHVSLIAADGGDNAHTLSDRINTSLNEAFAVDRLSDQDKDGIKLLWQEISADIGRGL